MLYICLIKQDNLQPNSGILISTEKVQRLTSEQESNKLDTSTPHLLIMFKDDDIV